MHQKETPPGACQERRAARAKGLPSRGTPRDLRDPVARARHTASTAYGRASKPNATSNRAVGERSAFCIRGGEFARRRLPAPDEAVTLCGRRAPTQSCCRRSLAACGLRRPPSGAATRAAASSRLEGWAEDAPSNAAGTRSQTDEFPPRRKPARRSAKAKLAGEKICRCSMSMIGDRAPKRRISQCR